MPFIESRTYTHYKAVICPDMLYICALKNIMQLPRLTRCVLNTSSGTEQEKRKRIAAQIALHSVAGQRNKTTRSSKSIANFQLRQNVVLGCAVNIRNFFLYSFLDQYIAFILPSISSSMDTKQQVQNTTYKYKKSAKGPSLRSNALLNNVTTPLSYDLTTPTKERSTTSTKHNQRGNTLYDGMKFAQRSKKSTMSMDYNNGVTRLTLFPGLEQNFLIFSNCGGLNCTLSVFVPNQTSFNVFLTALQIPILS